MSLKHLWTDCEEEDDAVVAVSSSSTTTFNTAGDNNRDAIMEDGRKVDKMACSCCTRCFPKKKQQKKMEAVAAVN